MSSDKMTLKSALLDFLKNDTAKQPTITLDCNWSHSLKLSDHKNYYFVSKNLKRRLKEDDKVPEEKNFKITLSKWNFVVEGTKKGVKEIDIEVKKYSVKVPKEDIDFSKRNRDLFDYPDIKSKLEADNKASAKKASVKKAKTKTNEKVKQLKAEPKSVKKEPKDTPSKKKIDKLTSGQSSILKTLKSTKSANKIADKSFSTKLNGQSTKESPLTREISYKDIIQAKDFDGMDNQRSTTKMLRFQTSGTQISRVASPHQVNQESLHRLSSALGRAVTQHSFDNVLPESLKEHGMSFKEFLMGRDKGLVSAREIVFNRNVIDMFLKEYQKRTVDPYN